MPSSETGGRYHIGMVSRLTGLSQHTLRVWERRYGVVDPQRTAGGNRVYSDAEVVRLRLLRQLTAAGHSIGQIAGLSTAALQQLPARDPGAGELLPLDFKARFLAALERMDLETAEAILSRAASSFGPRELVLEVLAPIASEIGERWQCGALRIAHEHAASALLRNLLGALMRSHKAAPGAHLALATTPAGELHELGALMAALLAVAHGWRVIYLGPNLPASEILHVADKSGARAVLLSVVSDEASFGAELAAVAEALPANTSLIIGGSGASRAAPIDERVIVAERLIELEPLLTRPLRGS